MTSKPKFQLGWTNDTWADLKLDEAGEMPHGHPLAAILSGDEDSRGRVEWCATRITARMVEVVGLDPEPGGDTFTVLDADERYEYDEYHEDTGKVVWAPQVGVQMMLDYAQVQFMAQFFQRVEKRMQACQQREAQKKAAAPSAGNVYTAVLDNVLAPNALAGRKPKP